MSDVQDGEQALKARISEETAKLYPQARSEAWRAFQKAPHVLELAELESQALFGLAQAAARWLPYCAERGHDPWAFHYYAAFCLRRMRGAILDAMRAADWVTRAERTRAKQLRDIGQEYPMSEQELAAVTGMSPQEVRSTMAVVSARPVSMDAEPHDFASEDDVQSSALVSLALEAASCTVRSLPPDAQRLLVLRYYYGKSVADAAAIAGVGAQCAAEVHFTAVTAVHRSLAEAVTAV